VNFKKSNLVETAINLKLWVLIFSTGIFLFGGCQKAPTRVQTETSSEVFGFGWNEKQAWLDVRDPFERGINPIPWAAAFETTEFCSQGKKELSEKDFIKMSERLAHKGVSLETDVFLVTGSNKEPHSLKRAHMVQQWLLYLGVEQVQIFSADQIKRVTRSEKALPKPSVEAKFRKVTVPFSPCTAR
jgi:hypothetical protein